MADEAVDLDSLDSLGTESQAADSAAGSAAKPSRVLRNVVLKVSAQDLGKADGLRHTILTLVTQEHYQRAIDRLKEFSELKTEYPQFEVRAGRYVSYSCDLINAIKAKRSFPGIKMLAMAKQQELYDRAMEHFSDLMATLKKIEQIDREVRAEDLRATVWIVKALVYSFCAVLGFLFLRELSKGVLPSAGIVLDDGFNGMTDWLFDSLGI